jgi:DNA-binding SARP family transcriptional activator/Flp pilus assembly protein TadD
VVAAVGIPEEFAGLGRPGPTPPVHVRMLGRLTIWRGTAPVALPASRKVRALFAYLALAPRPATRSQLCELFWDVPNDPRGELRWCLSKIRSLIDQRGHRRVQTRGDTVWLDLSDCLVDAIEIGRATGEGIQTLPPARQRALVALFTGQLLEGLELGRSPMFDGWLTAQRRRFRGCHAALLEHLVKGIPDDDAFPYLEQWLRLAPFDPRVHELLLDALARRGQIREGEEHLAATARLFEGEGLDVGPLRDAWRSARERAAAAPHARATVSLASAPAPTSDRDVIVVPAARRASVAVMPFVDRSPTVDARGGPADALADDVITRLAKLRVLFVIAQGTVFALHERHVGPEEAGRMLNVDYVVSGTIRRDGKRLTVTVELTETRTARIVWAEVMKQTLDDAFLVIEEVGNRIVASVASEIETIERNRAILRPPSSLDAWEAHHRGLWHMYRFSKADNERARHFFEAAVRLDPTFARAYAGLSFTHFQNAFQGWAKRVPAVDRALKTATQGLMADDRDPAAHWAMGRALWLRGQDDRSVLELERAIDLSPNFALGHYTLAFVNSQAGDAKAAISSSDYSRRLSPFDPLLFGMLGTRAMALVRLGRFEEAAEWAVKAASRPNAHPHILGIAAYSLALAGSLDQARAWAATLQRAHPGYDIRDFLAAFRFDANGAAQFRRGAKRIGMAPIRTRTPGRLSRARDR